MTERGADNSLGGRQVRESFDAALRTDAALIPADITAGLERRIEAALARERFRAVMPERREIFSRPWLAGSLVGLGAAAMVLLLVGRVDEPASGPAPTPEVSAVNAVMDDGSAFPRSFRAQWPLNAEPAQLTAPLERELRNLRSDLEKARENVERDLELTF